MSATTPEPGVEGWEGDTPAKGFETSLPLYPAELNADFAFLPSGSGSRKFVGDALTVLESVVALAMAIRRFDFASAEEDQVNITTDATIHTLSGLNARMRKRRLHGETVVDGEGSMAGASST